jgi:hypothetical protein
VKDRAAKADAEKIKVLYIGGYSRSGSTLLLRVMAEAHGVVAVGELVNIWSRAFEGNQLCGCGQPFRRCPFWSEVSHAAFGITSDEVPAKDLGRLQREVHEYPGYLKLWLPTLRTASYQRALDEYSGIIGSLYRAIAEVSGSRLIIDSSKLPQFARMLSEVPSIELHLVHLVRDSRGTAFSWRRPKVRTEIHWSRQEMKRYSVVRSAAEWDAYNILLSLDRNRPQSYALLRYEDLVRAPGKTLAILAENAGEHAIASELCLTRDEVALNISHTVSGNPSRFISGITQITSDEEWQNSMPPAERLITTAMTAPLLYRYGYPIGTGHRSTHLRQFRSPHPGK